MHITYQFLQAPIYFKSKFVQYVFLKCYLLNYLCGKYSICIFSYKEICTQSVLIGSKIVEL